mgnify:CR=1 FL=1
MNQTVEARLFDLRGKLLSIQRFQMDIPANSVRVAEKTNLVLLAETGNRKAEQIAIQ